MNPSVSVAIDASALRHNLKVARSRAPGSRVMAVIKANAYGHGLTGAAHALIDADAFAVARLGEGLALREAGIGNPIVLLGGVADASELAAAVRARFALVVHTEAQVQLLREARGGAPLDVWLKFDSGMNRLGFKGDAFAEAYRALSGFPGVRTPIGLMSHFASADRREDPQNASQLELFRRISAGLPGERSLANSAAMLNFPDARGDWVRPGLLLYGVSPLSGATGAELGLRPVMTLESRIIALKEVAAGERVGYGGTWQAARAMRLAIASVGYGDGYPRNLPSGSPVLVNGHRAPLAGRVSMDMIGIDVTGIEPQPKLGDPVLLWGSGLPVEEVAARAGSISYELLCGISQRVAISSRRTPS